MRHPEGLRASLASSVDQYFDQTVMLLHGDGTNGSQNNTFLDSSTNNMTMVRTGDASQGTFTPFSLPDGRWSNYFDGSGDRLQIPSSTAIEFGTGAFTIEAWVYPVSRGNSFTIYLHWSGSGARFGLTLSSSGSVAIDTTQGLGLTFTTVNNVTAPLNQWSHVAVTRSGNTYRTFINGVINTTATSSSTYTPTGVIASIGDYPDDFSTGYGYISNLRILKGTAQYTATFTPPTSPLTAIANTSLLTCQSNWFKDNSSNNFTLTPSGLPRVSAFGLFPPPADYSTTAVGGSMYLDGGSEYLDTNTGTNLNLGTSDFTIESWVYFDSLTAEPVLFDQRSTNTASAAPIFWIRSDGQGQLYRGSTLIQQTSTGAISAGEWTHIAITRSGTSFRTFVNGVLAAGPTTLSFNFSAVQPVRVGAGQAAQNNAQGYFCDFRYVIGTALYTANFTPPTAPLTAITNTRLLLSFTNAGIIDSSGKNVLGTSGTAQVSTAVKKYGTGSLSFDGNGDFLFGPYTPEIDLLTGSFTIEAWIYTTNLKAGGQRIFATGGGTVGFNSTTGIHVLFQINDNTGTISLQLASGTGTPRSLNSTLTVPANTWTYVAAVYDAPNTTMRVFVDGTVRSSSVSAPVRPSTNPTPRIATITGEGGSSTTAFQGYIDDLRVTKGIARYSASFTPPTQPFANR